MRTWFTQLKLGVNEMGGYPYDSDALEHSRITWMCGARGGKGGLALIGPQVHFSVKAMRTLLIAVLLVFPIFGGAAEDWPLSNWLWELPPERQTFSGLLTGENFRKVIRELETRRSVDFMALRPLDGRHAFVHPVGQIGDPPRHSKGVEAAEILNGLRMDRYRERCEKLKNITLQGTPSVYPTEMPFLEDR